jgi:hypothetical protein
MYPKENVACLEFHVADSNLYLIAIKSETTTLDQLLGAAKPTATPKLLLLAGDERICSIAVVNRGNNIADISFLLI